MFAPLEATNIDKEEINRKVNYVHVKCYKDAPNQDNSSAGKLDSSLPQFVLSYYKCPSYLRPPLGLYIRTDTLDGKFSIL